MEPTPLNEDLDVPILDSLEAPRHGYRGELPRFPGIPKSVTLAISRGSGARRAASAKRAGEKLQWQVYSQDLLEFLSQDETFRQQMLDQLPAGADGWVEEEMNRLLKQQNLSRNPPVMELARTVL